MKNLTLRTPENSHDIATTTANLKDLFLSGDNQPLDVYARLKAAAEIIDNVLKDAEVKEAIMAEADNYKDKTFEAHGALWTKKMVGVRYDFTCCGDPTYNDLSDQKKTLESRIKIREAHLKTLPDDGEVITDKTTGETVLIYPPVKTGSESIQCKLK